MATGKFRLSKTTATTSRSEQEGFVYLAVNPAWPGRVKVGRTTNPEKRLSQYQTASPFRDWEFAACVWFPDHYAAEREMLKRLNTTNEWAEVDSHFASKILNQLKDEVHAAED
jgi:T5orf172 domain